MDAMTVIALGLLALTACAVPTGPADERAPEAQECSAGTDDALVERLSRGNIAFFVVRPLAGRTPTTVGTAVDPDEVFEEARRKMLENRAGRQVSTPKQGMSFEVLAAYGMVAPPTLQLPPPHCEAPAYLAFVGAQATPIVVPIAGADDPLISVAAEALPNR